MVSHSEIHVTVVVLTTGIVYLKLLKHDRHSIIQKSQDGQAALAAQG